MLGFKKPGWAGLRVVLLLGVVVAAFGAGGVSPVNAMAEECETLENIKGEGATLQKVAQEVWTGAGGFKNLCGNKTVTYTASGSGAGLHAWGGDDGTTYNAEDDFIASDDAPTTAQLGNMQNSIEAATGTLTDLVVVPVTQTAIAIVAKPPAGCTLTTITNHDLELVFRGHITLWKEITGASGGANCESNVTRVVREEGSGTTYQFKHYLSRINSSTFSCVPTIKDKKGNTLTINTWEKLQENNTTDTPNPNTTWPTAGTGCSLSAIEKAAGGKAVAELVAGMSGSIGYAALADAENGTSGGTTATILKVQNNGTELTPTSPLYTKPFTEIGKNANCNKAEYSIPANAGTGVNVDWSGAYGGNPNIAAVTGEDTYPLCTLTWDVAKKLCLKICGHGKFLTVKAYFEHMINAGVGGGQEELEENWYAPLPTAVETAAATAVSKIE